MRSCFYCGESVDPMAVSTYRRVVGWERKALSTPTSRRKGGSDIKLREPREEFAHAACVDRAAAGINTKQETLL